MEICEHLNSGLDINSIVSHVSEKINQLVPDMQDKLAKDPLNLRIVEEETLAFGREIAGLITTGILASSSVQEAISQKATKIRRNSERPLRKVYTRPRNVRFLSGLEIKVLPAYYVPRRDKSRRGPKRDIGRRGPDGVGLYPEWAALGIREGVSPGLQSEVGRLVALLPSMETAREELVRRGVDLHVNTVRRISVELGLKTLAHRRDEILSFRNGTLNTGDELKDKRVAVTVDGGRVRTRVPKKGKKTAKGRTRFDTPWREPKLVKIYELDKKGQIDRAALTVIDGTLQGPDHLMEIVAYHLYRLGAAKAKSVEFIGDGVDWIWDRIPAVVEKVGIDPCRVYQAVDVSHVVAHISKALSACCQWTEKARKKQLTILKKKILNGKVDEVITYLKTLKRGRRSASIEEQIKYLSKRKHLMKYDRLRRKKLPVGSGAIESAIRRIINLRLKGPGSFWYEENAEAIMMLRAYALAGDWENMMSNVLKHNQKNRKLNWTWEADTLSIKKIEKLQAAKIKRGYRKTG